MSRPSRNFSATFFVRKKFCVGNSAISTKRRALAVQGEREHAARRWMKARLEKPSHSLESLHRPKRRLHIAGGRVQAPPKVIACHPKSCRPHFLIAALCTSIEARVISPPEPKSHIECRAAHPNHLHHRPKPSWFFYTRVSFLVHVTRTDSFDSTRLVSSSPRPPFPRVFETLGCSLLRCCGHRILKARAAPDRVRSIAKCGSERWEKTVQILAWRRASQGRFRILPSREWKEVLPWGGQSRRGRGVRGERG